MNGPSPKELDGYTAKIRRGWTGRVSQRRRLHNLGVLNTIDWWTGKSSLHPIKRTDVTGPETQLKLISLEKEARQAEMDDPYLDLHYVRAVRATARWLASIFRVLVVGCRLGVLGRLRGLIFSWGYDR
jgi:hypothetical protein